MEDTEQRGPGIENGSEWWNGTVHFDRTGPTEKRSPLRKVDRFFRNFSGWTEPIHSVLDRNFRKFWLNGSRPLSAHSPRPRKIPGWIVVVRENFSVSKPVLNERETGFASGMERDRSNLSRSIRHQNIFEPQPGNFGWMDCAQCLSADEDYRITWSI